MTAIGATMRHESTSTGGVLIVVGLLLRVGSPVALHRRRIDTTTDGSFGYRGQALTPQGASAVFSTASTTHHGPRLSRKPICGAIGYER
jgi:hypothetical protein